MTVSSTDSVVAFVGNGVQTAFPCSFKVFEAGHVQVHVDGELQELTTDYTLSGVPGDSFTVNFVVAPANAAAVSIARILPLTQETDYLENDEFPAETHERALDLLTMMVQQVAQGKAVRFPSNDPAALTGILPEAADRAQKLLAFASNGEVVAVDGADLGAFSVGDQHTWTAQQIMQVAANTDGWTLQDLSGNTLAKFRATSGTARGSLIVTDGAGNEGAIVAGSGDPEGVRGAQPGTIYINSLGGAGTVLFQKESGAGTTTGWKPLGLREPTFTEVAGATQTVTGIKLARRITIFLWQIVSTNTVPFELIIGSSSGLETDGYAGRRTELSDSAVSAVNAQTSAFGIYGNAVPGNSHHGKIVLELMHAPSNRWLCQSRLFTTSSQQREIIYNGMKTLPGVLDKFRLQIGSGTFTGNMTYWVE